MEYDHCIKCGKRIDEVNLITGIATPCGHKQISDKQVKENKQRLNQLNKDILYPLLRKV